MTTAFHCQPNVAPNNQKDAPPPPPPLCPSFRSIEWPFFPFRAASLKASSRLKDDASSCLTQGLACCLSACLNLVKRDKDTIRAAFAPALARPYSSYLCKLASLIQTRSVLCSFSLLVRQLFRRPRPISSACPPFDPIQSGPVQCISSPLLAGSTWPLVLNLAAWRISNLEELRRHFARPFRFPSPLACFMEQQQAKRPWLA